MPASSRPNRLERFVLRTAAARPELGQFRVALLAQRQGLAASPSGVRSILKRHGLETLYKRMSAITLRKRDGTGPSLFTERQLERFKRAGKTHAVLDAASASDRHGRSRARRDHLFTVAAEMFARHGYENTTLKQIADAAGLLPGSMYHYIQSKDDLVAKVLHQGFRQLNAAVDNALEGCTDPWKRLEAICTVHLEQPLFGNAIDAFAAISILVRDRRSLDRRLIKERNSYEDRFRAVVGALPLPAHIDRSLLRLAMLGALNWTNLWFKPGGRRTRAEIARRFVELIRR